VEEKEVIRRPPKKKPTCFHGRFLFVCPHRFFLVILSLMNTNDLDAVVDFLYEAGMLAKTPRSGFFLFG
jgi:hypothetical protein